MSTPSCTVTITTRAAGDLRNLPEKVAPACAEFAYGPLADNPHRLGTPPSGEFRGPHTARPSSYRVVHAIRIAHRADAHR